MIWRVLPLAGAVLLVGIPLCWRPWLHYRRHGSWGIALFRSRRPGPLGRGGLAVVAFLLLLGQGFAAAAWPASIAPLGAASALSLAVRRAVGALLLLGGLSFLVAAQLDLGASWRIGIEEDARPGLRTGGLYSGCRNPIYVGLRVTLAGYAPPLPTRPPPRPLPRP